MVLPKKFDERIKSQLGDEYDDYIKCFDSDMYHGIRVNTSKISVEDSITIIRNIHRPSIRIIMRDFIIYRNRVP